MNNVSKQNLKVKLKQNRNIINNNVIKYYDFYEREISV